MSALFLLLQALLILAALAFLLCGLVWVCIRVGAPYELFIVTEREPLYREVAPGLSIVIERDPIYRGVA